MHKTTKKIFGALGMLSLCGVLHADQQMASPAQKKKTEQGTAKMDQITPNAGPRVTNGADLFITADFIYWKVQEDQLSYASTGFANASLVPSVTHAGKVQELSFRYLPGFKVGLGLDLSHDGWDVFAQYTWLATKQASGSVTENADNFGTILATRAPFFGHLLNATGSWKISFNAADLELGRNYYISKRLTLRPHFGLKGAWQQQHYRANYSGVLMSAIGPIPAGSSLTSSLSADQSFKAIGIRTGMNDAWHFSKQWSIYGDLALSALWGFFKAEQVGQQAIAGDSTVLLNVHDQNHTLIPVLEMGLGLRWEIWFYDDSYHFALQAGWEEQLWWNMNHLTAQSNLNMQGLTIQARFDF